MINKICEFVLMAQLYMMFCVIKIGQQLMEGECIRFYLDTHRSLPMNYHEQTEICLKKNVVLNTNNLSLMSDRFLNH